MKRLWSHQDGRLKIGSVSITLFVMLLALAGGLMQLNQPVDEALVQVKHIFRSEPDAVQDIVEEAVADDKVAEKTAAKEPPGNETSIQVEQSVPLEQSSPEVGEVVAAKEVAPVASTMPDEHKQDEGGSRVSLPQDSLTSGGKLLKPVLGAEAGDEQEAVETVKFEIAEVVQPVVTEVSDPFYKLKQKAALKTSDKQQPKTVIVSVEQYRETFKAWRTTGLESDYEAARPGLLVENLREVYPLLQMKPVVMVDGVAYDLEDGSRLDDRSLNRYTATVFRVEQPWADWGTALRRIGLRPTDDFEVHYYVHNYVHNGIYGRCAQAIAWGKANGLLPDDVKTAEIEVRGRAYTVRQQGGGQFGVFVPRQLRLLDGQIVTVDPDALQGAVDVALLQEAKIL